MHLPFADFCCLTPDELALCAGAFARERTDTQRAAWERTRTLAAIAVQPHVKGKVSPKRLLPLPWDNEHHTHAANRPTEPQPTKEQALQRVRQLLGKPSN